jgi:hypothetical protein
LRVPPLQRRAHVFASLALAIGLVLCAPLVHTHLEAGAAAQGFCGDHLPDGAPAPAGDTCSLCLAGAHAPALREPDLLCWHLRTERSDALPVAPEPDLGLARGRPGTPRAPPLSA